MLREWIRNLPTGLLREIVGNRHVRGNRIWQLACSELDRRYGVAA